MARPLRSLALALPPTLAASTTASAAWQSVLDPKGPQAEAIADLFWSFTILGVVVWALTVTALGLALARRRQDRPDPLVLEPGRERRFSIVVASAVGLTAITLIVLTALSYAGQKQLFTGRSTALTVKVIGHQWWWEVRYEDDRPDRTFTTANEIHLPVGERVTVKLASTDVIHSFWVPNVMGKQDMIPGRENQIQFTVEEPGVYRGQCAEFCGWQHAHMALLVIAEPRADFESWREQQLKPAAPPEDDERKAGEQVFMANPCVMCHAIRGTPAGGKVGPDLTHIGSRRTIAAGTLPRSRGTLAAWAVDPQSIKPGVHMPLVQLRAEDVNALASYLDGLR